MRKGVSLTQTALRRDLLVTAGEGNRLKGNEGDLLRVLAGKIDDRAHLVVIHTVHQRGDQNDLNAGLVHVLDGPQLHIKQVADLTMAVGVIADAVELQVSVTQACFESAAAELLAFGKFNTIGRGLNAVVSQLAGVADGIKEIGRHRGLAPGELYGHLPARFDLERVVQDLPDVFPGQFVHEPHLVRIHEAGVAHHVAAICQIHGQYRTAAMLDRARSMVVKAFIVVSPNVAAGEVLLNPGQELGINRHHIFVTAVDRAVLHHPHLAITLDDAGFDLAHLLRNQRLPVVLSAYDLLTRFLHTTGTERVRLTGKSQRRLGFLPGLEKRLIGPFGSERRIRAIPIDKLNTIKGRPGRGA